MELPQIVGEREWRRARVALLNEEKELSRVRDALNAKRRQLPMVEITKSYTLTGPGGPVGLIDLFEGRRQLLSYHFMFEPDWNAGCPSCSYTIDNVGHLSHLHARNTTLALVSRADFDRISVYRDRMGWNLPWYSSADSDFNFDFGVTIDADRPDVEYNYRPVDELIAKEGESWRGWSGEMPGISAFLRDGTRVFHTYSTYARGIDMLVNTYNWLDLTVLGRQEDWELPSGRADGSHMQWLRRHDEYSDRHQR